MDTLDVSLAHAEQRLPLQRMLELYQHDLSDLWDQDLDAHGDYGYPLDRHFARDAAWPYVFRVDGRYAGFALVDTQVRLPGGDFWMEQFFVLRKYRRRGVGARAACRVFACHPGRWQVGQMPANTPAQAFWRRVITRHCGGAFAETMLTTGRWQGLVQSFMSPAPTG
ncbi:MAG: hypothetical protein JNM26_11245 [Ideonella sp.]|nr:hypothetical protein [Ideonella sp.]